jgi:polysaccharide export outer membrane protein
MKKAKLLSHVFRIALAMPLVLVPFSASAQAQNDKPATLQPGQLVSPAAASEVVAIPLPTVVNANKVDDSSASPAEVAAHEARIGPSDTLEVRVFGVPEMSQELRVSNAGKIVLPMIGQVSVQGLTTAEVEDKIAATLRNGGFMNDPQVNVSAKELHSAAVFVTGEVGKPGIYPVFGSCRLLDIITIAGGVTPKSGHLVTVTRGDKAGSSINVDISSRDVEVFPGDTVKVTKAGVVYVLGDVGHASGFIIENRLTVLEALALAGGTGKDAKIGRARIIRKGPQGVEELPIPLKEILKAQKEDMELLAGDVLYVPTSEGKAAVRLAANSIIQGATMLAIVRP